MVRRVWVNVCCHSVRKAAKKERGTVKGLGGGGKNKIAFQVYNHARVT